MIQFTSHYTERYSYLDSIRLALRGGCRWVQLRMKEASYDEIKSVAIEAQQLCHDAGATFIIDDHVELVKELHADGVHLGMKDMPIADARRLLGLDFIIGGTANTIDDVRLQYTAGASSIGCGTVRFTTTKKGLAPVLGLEGYHDIMQAMTAEGIRLPVVAIGGITAEDIPDIIRTGIDGVAVSGTVLRASDPVAEMQRLIAFTEEKF